ncbi:hypothetical protein COR50_17740 [Chitinophaga caeni]|uniref:Peptidase M19 n=1 Tax=Chitinophaga caeni TaxID=2029983 RepID=A0A291QY40_9BACT|nr:hypothetical protein [Chitinophaga caeni]ATL48858.1 hypothetical protein COR50_17740 [Chitinophaga caeni]
MSHFDFHMHPVFKRYICQFESLYPTQRKAEELLLPIDMKNPLIDLLEENFLHILESQVCLSQMKKGDLQMGVAAIAPVEEIFVQKNGLFGKILNSQFFTAPVDQTIFKLIRDHKISYYQLLLRELNLYKLLYEKGQIHILNRAEGKVPATNGQPVLAIGIEGGHSLSRSLVRRPGEPDTILVNSQQPLDALVKDFLDNPLLSAADSLRHLQQAMWKEKMDICYLVLTHLSYIPEQFLATHAFGMKMIESEAVYPYGNGISQQGKEVIDAAYTMKVGNKSAQILIDIKHMALKSRLDFYAYRQEKNYALPIIASHMGVTGCSIEEWKFSLESSRLLNTYGVPFVGITMDRSLAGYWGAINKEFTFNSWSINLMDEDIEEVMKSKGMIGLSLDVRILGWQAGLAKKDKEEYLSWEDFRFFFPDEAKKLSPGDMPYEESYLLPTKQERHPLALCFNILHIVAVGNEIPGCDPWQHICIGSDYDGLINPVANCRDAAQLPALGKALARWLPIAEKTYVEERQLDWLLPRKKDGIDKLALEKIVQGILFENGRSFLENWVGQKL